MRNVIDTNCAYNNGPFC